MQYLYLDRGSWEIQIADEPPMIADVEQEVKVILVRHIRRLIKRRQDQIITTINRSANMSLGAGNRGTGPSIPNPNSDLGMMGLANTERHVNYNHPSIGLVDNSEDYKHPTTSNNIYQRSPIYSSPGTKPTRGLRDGDGAGVMGDLGELGEIRGLGDLPASSSS